MATYAARKFYPTALQIDAPEPDTYDWIERFIDNDDTSKAFNSQGNSGTPKVVTFTGFSDGAAHTGPFTLFIDHEVDGDFGDAWVLQMEYSTNDGVAWTTFYGPVTQEPDLARALTAQVVGADVPKGDIQLRITFTNNHALDLPNVYQIFAGEAIMAGGIF